MTGVDQDPYLAWAKQPGTVPFLEKGWTAVLLQLAGISVADFAAGVMFADPVERSAFKKFVKVPIDYTEAPDATDANNPFCMAMVEFHYYFQNVTQKPDSPLALAIAGFDLGLPLDPAAFRP
jgi:hypothetical protein